MRVKFSVLSLKNHSEYQILAILLIILETTLYPSGIYLLAVHNLSKLKSLAYNAKIRSLLKFLLIWYFKIKGQQPVIK